MEHEYTFTDHLDPMEHDRFVQASEQANLLQSSAWARIKDNWNPLWCGAYDNGKLAASALVLMRPLPLGFTFFYLPRGPVMDFSNQELVSFFLKNLQKTARKHRALFIKMDPSLELSRYTMEDPQRHEDRIAGLTAPLEKAGARYLGPTMEISQTIQPRHHAIIFKQEDYEAALPKKTRKLIKEADKREVQIISGGKELLDDFAALVEKTEARKGVSLRNRAYFEKLLNAYGDDSVIMLAVIDPAGILKKRQEALADIESQLDNLPANQKKKRFTLEEKKASILKDIDSLRETFQDLPDHPIPIAGVLTVIYGEQAEMLYAGMDETFRRFMPQYKQYVENIRWAFDRGCTRFSMGGIEGDLQDGLSHFKNHFNPLVVEYIGEFDLPTFRLLYPISKKLFERVKGNL